MIDGACNRCVFFEYDRGDIGQCHRLPAAIFYDVSEDDYISTWPTVDLLDWCGEFVPERADSMVRPVREGLGIS